ncbi:DegT/DnrJ/EryC1/StrS family aminotransferase [Alloiococcus sp. CFN-8]|uniref:DegT/DnrJ/EryC1/StrS family aminotransferase n=1 Tax=Alloiococcus sp. CFN-8 TaxID=3416081 RepID=UPI003CF0472D
MAEKIFLSSPHMSDEGYEMMYVKEAFDSNWVAPLGENVDEFERELAHKVDIGYAVALTSGTAAIHMALKAVGVGKGDIVFCPSLTFSATANPIIYQDAIPVFIDSDFSTWNMSPEALKKAFEKYPNVKAVIVVHLYGLSADMDRIMDICKEYNTPIIEDAAESLGTYYKGKHTGTFGEYGIFSFNGNKIITTSGGGMLVSNNEKMINKVRFWSTQSKEPARHYQHNEIGFNYRMSNIVAGIGRGQLKVLDQRVAKKKYIYDYYKKELEGLDGVEFMPVNKWDNPNCWLTSILLSGDIKPIDVMLALETENIESRPVWKPMHLQPVFTEYDFISSLQNQSNGKVTATHQFDWNITKRPTSNSVSEDIFNRGICLPSDSKMTDEDLSKVCKIIKGLWNEYKSSGQTEEYQKF